MDAKINHLLLRAGFGTNPAEVARMGWNTVDDVLDDIFITKRFTVKTQGSISKEAAKDVKMIKSRTVKMNLDWLLEMATTTAVLQEKMTFFWHDHFGVKANLPVLGAQHNNLLRKHALGKFGKLLHAVAKDPAMLLFLNNQQNKKTAPNENFARELFELFTLGEGNYSERDIKEAARSFTGWKTDHQGEFRFVRIHHDFGKKTIFGRQGNFSGEEVIDMVLKKPETARYISDKIVDFMAGKQVSQSIRKDLAKKYYRWELHTGKLLKEIFSSDWFYNTEVVGSRIKSPIELLVGIMRAYQLDESSGAGLLLTQRSLAQVLFSPPSVAGWPSEQNWIDSSSLLYRQNLGFAVLLTRELKGVDKANFDAMMKEFQLSGKRGFEASTDYWDALNLMECCDYMFSKPPKAELLLNIDQISETVENPKAMRLALLMGLPEYQLC